MVPTTFFDSSFKRVFSQNNPFNQEKTVQFSGQRNCAKNRTTSCLSKHPLPAGARYGRNVIGMHFYFVLRDLFPQKTGD